MNSLAAGFDWDDGNLAHCLKHGVSRPEVEGLFSSPVSAPYMHQGEIESYEKENPDL